MPGETPSSNNTENNPQDQINDVSGNGPVDNEAPKVIKIIDGVTFISLGDPISTEYGNGAAKSIVQPIELDGSKGKVRALGIEFSGKFALGDPTQLFAQLPDYLDKFDLNIIFADIRGAEDLREGLFTEFKQGFFGIARRVIGSCSVFVVEPKAKNAMQLGLVIADRILSGATGKLFGFGTVGEAYKAIMDRQQGAPK